MRLLDRFNAVPGSPGSALHGELSGLPRLVFDHSRKHGFTAIPTPLRYPPGAKALAAFATWTDLAGHYELAPTRGKSTAPVFKCRIVVDDTDVLVWVPLHGMSVQTAIDLVDTARQAVVRG